MSRGCATHEKLTCVIPIEPARDYLMVSTLIKGTGESGCAPGGHVEGVMDRDEADKDQVWGNGGILPKP